MSTAGGLSQQLGQLLHILNDVFLRLLWLPGLLRLGWETGLRWRKNGRRLLGQCSKQPILRGKPKLGLNIVGIVHKQQMVRSMMFEAFHANSTFSQMQTYTVKHLNINMFVSQAKLLMETISFSDILSKLSVRRVSVDGDVNQIDSLSLIFGSKTIQVFPKRRKL